MKFIFISMIACLIKRQNYMHVFNVALGVCFKFVKKVITADFTDSGTDLGFQL